MLRRRYLIRVDAVRRQTFLKMSPSESSGLPGSPSPSGPLLKACWKGDRQRGDNRPAHVKLDLRVRRQRDLSRVTFEQATVVDCGYVARGWPNSVGSELLSPHVEEVPEREGANHGRLDVDDPVRRVSVQPIEAAAATDEDSLRSAHRLRAFDSHPVRDAAGDAVVENRQVDVDVEGELLVAEALDAVDRPASGACHGEDPSIRKGDALGPERTGRRGRSERAERRERGQPERRRGCVPLSGRPVMVCQHGPCRDCDDECGEHPAARTRSSPLGLGFQLRFAGEASSARSGLC